MSVDEPTRRIDLRQQDGGRFPADAPTTALPGPLNLAAAETPADTGSDTTDVLSLDELFDETAGDADAAAVRAPASAEADTWTAMPVVPVRSEPVRSERVQPAGGAPATPARPALASRVRTDASAAWDGTVRRTRAWLGRDDNALTLMTALVAVLLIIAVASLSR